MSNVQAFFWMSAGVAIAVVLPVLAAEVKARFKPTAARIDIGRYMLLLGFSLITGLLLLAFYLASNPSAELTWFAALLAGYGWEATIEKLAA